MSKELDIFLKKGAKKYTRILPCFEPALNFTGIASISDEEDSEITYFCFTRKKFLFGADLLNWESIKTYSSFKPNDGVVDDEDDLFDFNKFILRSQQHKDTPSLHCLFQFSKEVYFLFYDNDDNRIYEGQLFTHNSPFVSIMSKHINELDMKYYCQHRQKMPKKFAWYN